MSSSSDCDSCHSSGEDDAVLTSHQDIKPSIKFFAYDNLSSSQDDYTIEKFISNNKDGRSPTECEIENLFQETNSKDVRSKPLTGEGDDIDGSYWLPSKPNYVSKVSLSPPSKDTTLVLSSSGERRIPFQQLNENRNQLSSSLSTTKPSSQQLDTSYDVDINNTKLSTQQITEPPQFKSTTSERDKIIFLHGIGIFEEFSVQNVLIRLGESLKTDDDLSDYAVSVRDRFVALQNLNQYSSADDIIAAHNSHRVRRNNNFKELRRRFSNFTLHAQNSQHLRTELHNISAFSFCTDNCLKNCVKRDGPGTDDLIDLGNNCLVYQRNCMFYCALQDGGTQVTPEQAADLFDRHTDQVDFFGFNSTSNSYDVFKDDLNLLWEVAGGNMSKKRFDLVVRLESVLNLLERAVIHFVLHGFAINILHNSFRNQEMGFEGDRAMIKSPHNFVVHMFAPHTEFVAGGGLVLLDKEEVTRIAEEFGYFVNLFDGLELCDGTVVQFKEGKVEFIERKGGLLGGKNAHDRKIEAVLKKKMIDGQVIGASRFHQLRSTTDYTTKEILAIIQDEFDTPSMKHVKGWVEQSEALALCRRLEENHPEWSMQKIFTELEKLSMFTEMANVGLDNSTASSSSNDISMIPQLSTPILLGPSITPLHGNDPALRLVKYGGRSNESDNLKYQLLDYDSHRFTSGSTHQWSKLYTFSEAYGIIASDIIKEEGLSSKVFQTILRSMEDDKGKESPVLELYRSYMISGAGKGNNRGVNDKCNVQCRNELVCTFQSATRSGYETCLSGRSQWKQRSIVGIVAVLGFILVFASFAIVRLRKKRNMRKNYESTPSVVGLSDNNDADIRDQEMI